MAAHDAAGHAGALPEVGAVRSGIESILLVVDAPVEIAALARALGVETEEVQACLLAMAEEYETRGNGFELRHLDAGWRLYTRASNAQAVEQFLLDGTQTRLSRAAMETLAVIAYRQPATRAQVAAVRGVNVDGVVRTLALRGLIREVEPDAATGAHRYETTELFLELLGLASLDDLPELAPLLPDIDAIDEYYEQS